MLVDHKARIDDRGGICRFDPHAQTIFVSMQAGPPAGQGTFPLLGVVAYLDLVGEMLAKLLQIFRAVRGFVKGSRRQHGLPVYY